MTDFQIDGYDVVHPPIGEGCTGEVYHAIRHGDPSGQRLIAKHYQAISVDREELLRNNIKFSQMPPSDEITQMLSYQLESTPYYALFECVDGATLDQRPPLKEVEAWRMITRIANAMGHAHKHGVIHGNLHPKNIHFEERAEGSGDRHFAIKVSDFGVGLLAESRCLDLYENAFFIAPEQLISRGKDYRVVTAKRWDVYSFGVIAFWLLTDHYPRGEDEIVSRTDEGLKTGQTNPVDIEGLGARLQSEKRRAWGRRLGAGEREHKWLSIIDQCLELNPEKRPVDMREVQNRFIDIEYDYKLIDAKGCADAALFEAENRHKQAQARQKAKLISARSAALILALSLFGASYLVVNFVKRSIDSRTRITQLDEVVADQSAFIEQLDTRVKNTAQFLRQSRRAADASFYRLTQQPDNPPSLTELEQARIYYSRVVDETLEADEFLDEKARALHSLAHIENLMRRKAEAVIHFELAIDALEKTIKDKSDRKNDTLKRLADCHEYIGLLSDESSVQIGYESTSRAIQLFTEVLEEDPSDKETALRMATICFRFGKYLYENNEFDQAIAAYTDSAQRIETCRELGHFRGDTSELDQMVSNLQFHAAEALYEEERINEAVDSYIASIESAERLRSLEGFGKEESLLMANSFVALGDIFSSSKAISPAQRDQVYNEALRLIVPLHREEPDDIGLASFQCRILTRLASLERIAGNTKDGYQLSVRGIEALLKALENNPDDLFGFIQLAEARLSHIRFLMKDQKKARTIALRGVDTAKHAHNLVAQNEGTEDYQYRGRLYDRLRQIFGDYGDLCEKLGQDKAATECLEYASFRVSQN